MARARIRIPRTILVLSIALCGALKPGLVLRESEDLLKGKPGITAPLGRFDPLNIASPENCTPETINWLRAAEVKHGRVSMLACVGYLVQTAGVHLPGTLSFSRNLSFESLSPLNPLEQWEYVPLAGKLQIIAFIGVTETLTELKKPHYIFSGQTPQIVYPEFDFSKVNPVTLFTKQNRELNNGRLAMIGIMSFIADYYVEGSVPGLREILAGNPAEAADSIHSIDTNDVLSTTGDALVGFFSGIFNGVKSVIVGEFNAIATSITKFQEKAVEVSSYVGDLIENMSKGDDAPVLSPPETPSIEIQVPGESPPIPSAGNTLQPPTITPPLESQPESLNNELNPETIAPSSGTSPSIVEEPKSGPAEADSSSKPSAPQSTGSTAENQMQQGLEKESAGTKAESTTGESQAITDQISQDDKPSSTASASDDNSARPTEAVDAPPESNPQPAPSATSTNEDRDAIFSQRDTSSFPGGDAKETVPSQPSAPVVAENKPEVSPQKQPSEADILRAKLDAARRSTVNAPPSPNSGVSGAPGLGNSNPFSGKLPHVELKPTLPKTASPAEVATPTF